MNILVVGGAGYIGGSVVDQLLETEHHVRVYDVLLYEEAYRKPVDFVLGDIRDHRRLLPHLEWADVVVWLAAIVGDPACSLYPEITIEVNQESVRWLADHYDGRIVFLSTCSVYGAQDGILDEAAPTRPLSVYAVTKLESEAILAGKNAIIFRLGTIYGIGDLYSRIRLDLVVNALTVQSHRNGRITVFGGQQFRPLLHVRDAALGVVQNVGTEQVGIFDLNQCNRRIVDLAEEIGSFFPGLQIATTERKFEDTRNYRVSGEKARRVLGFEPRLTVSDGIREIRDLVLSGRLKDLDNPRYTNHGFLTHNKLDLRLT